MDAPRYYQRVLWVACSHSLDVAHGVLLLLLIAAGILAYFIPTVGGIDVHGWQVATGVLVAIVVMRLALAPYWIAREQDEKVAALLAELDQLQKSDIRLSFEGFPIGVNTGRATTFPFLVENIGASRQECQIRFDANEKDIGWEFSNLHLREPRYRISTLISPPFFLRPGEVVWRVVMSLSSGEKDLLIQTYKCVDDRWEKGEVLRLPPGCYSARLEVLADKTRRVRVALAISYHDIDQVFDNEELRSKAIDYELGMWKVEFPKAAS